MDFETFHQLAIDNFDNGGDIVSLYDKEDFEEWVTEIGGEPTLQDVIALHKFYAECEKATGVKVELI